jgi:antitoxin component YwqK of YwqJK toxin-antitoxin module
MNRNKLKFHDIKNFAGTLFLLYLSIGVYAQDSTQALHHRKVFDPYKEYVKSGITSSDYVKDTLKLFFDDNWEKHEKKGASFFSIAYPLNGGWTCEDYDLFEKKLFNYMVYADQKLTTLNGVFYTFYNNGNAETIGQYLNNKKSGLWLTYYEDGKLNDSTYYLNNAKSNSYSFYSSGKTKSIIILDSLGTGAFTDYYETGAIRQTGSYSKSVWKEGAWIYYYPDGKISFVENYHDDKRIDVKCYDIQGKLKDTCEIERMPMFSGNLVKYLSNNIQWPRGLSFVDIDIAKVFVRFVVDINGNIDNIRIVKHIAKPFDDEVIRVVKRMPRWKPGLRYNDPVRVYYILPITFYKPR